MAKVFITTQEQAPGVDLPQGFAGAAKTQAYFDGDQDPIHVNLHHLAPGAVLRIGPKETDCVGYVWRGAAEAGGRTLVAKSSLIVERGASISVRGTEEGAMLITFRASQPPCVQRAGGHVHVLPAERAPRAAALSGSRGLGGAIYANASCPTCCVWLHENNFAADYDQADDAMSERGVHSHSEDEVIFVIDGQMRLGAQLYGPGSAIAIRANVFYSFGVGPEGLSFINFRAGLPAEIKLKNGGALDEVGYWRDRLSAPDYLSQ